MPCSQTFSRSFGENFCSLTSLHDWKSQAIPKETHFDVLEEFIVGHQVVIANQCWFADVYLAIEATFAFLNEHKIYPEGLNNCSSVEILPSYYNRRVDY